MVYAQEAPVAASVPQAAEEEGPEIPPEQAAEEQAAEEPVEDWWPATTSELVSPTPVASWPAWKWGVAIGGLTVAGLLVWHLAQGGR